VLGEATKKRHSKVPSKKKPSQITEQDMLLDLMGGDSSMPSTDTSATMNGSANNADLLADILGGTSVSSPTSASPVANGSSQNNMSSIMDLFDSGSSSTPQPQAQRPQAQTSSSNDLFGGMGSPPPQQQQQPSAPTHTAYDKNDLSVTFTVQRSAQAVQLLARFKNQSAFENFGALNLQAAVPKSQKLQLQAISSAELVGGQEATQQMRVTSVQGVSLIFMIPCFIKIICANFLSFL
jgi:AP-1 complex subunit gamma-1